MKSFFGFTKIKFIFFTVFSVIVNIIPSWIGGMCVDGFDFAYCITFYGFPLPSIIITGELSNLPGGYLSYVISGGLWLTTLLNVFIAYIIISLVFAIYYKFIRTRPNYI